MWDMVVEFDVDGGIQRFFRPFDNVRRVHTPGIFDITLQNFLPSNAGCLYHLSFGAVVVEMS